MAEQAMLLGITAKHAMLLGIMERDTGWVNQCYQHDLINEYQRRIQKHLDGREVNLNGTRVAYTMRSVYIIELMKYDICYGYWDSVNRTEHRFNWGDEKEWSGIQIVLELPPSRARLLCPLVHQLAKGQQPVAKLLLEFLDLPWDPPPPPRRYRRSKRHSKRLTDTRPLKRLK
jgi:hypothetical protein